MRQVAEAPTGAEITGLILAGGQGQRMGGSDKGLIDLDGRPLIAYVIARLAPQVSTILISANRNPAHYAALGGAAILPDEVADYPGPLAGILSGLRAATTPWLAVVPCDSPFLPLNLVSRLAGQVPSSQAIAVIRAGGELQPVFALIPTALHASLAEFLHQIQSVARHQFQHLGKCRFTRRWSFHNERPTSRRTDRDACRTGVSQFIAVLARMIDVKFMMRVFDDADPQAARLAPRNQLPQQGSLATPAEASEAEDQQRRVLSHGASGRAPVAARVQC